MTNNGSSSRSSWRSSVASIFGSKKNDGFDFTATTTPDAPRRSRFSVSRWSTSSTATTSSTASTQLTTTSSRGDWDDLLAKSNQRSAQQVQNNYSDPSEPNKQRHGPGHGPDRMDSDANEVFFY